MSNVLHVLDKIFEQIFVVDNTPIAKPIITTTNPI